MSELRITPAREVILRAVKAGAVTESRDGAMQRHIRADRNRIAAARMFALDQPELLHMGYDRAPGLDVEWWRPLLADGLIAPPGPDDTSPRCTVTEAGRAALAAFTETKE